MRKGHDTITIENQHRELARTSIEAAARNTGFDFNKPENQAFFEQMVEIIAGRNAWDCFNHRIINNPVVIKALSESNRD